MKKKRFAKKLSLSRQTLRRLDAGALDGVVGGVPHTGMVCSLNGSVGCDGSHETCDTCDHLNKTCWCV